MKEKKVKNAINDYYFELKVYNPKGEIIEHTIGTGLSKKYVEGLRIDNIYEKKNGTLDLRYKKNIEILERQKVI